MDLFLIFVSSALINNYVLTRFLGLCPFFGVSKRTEAAVGMGLAVTFVLALASAITWVFQLLLVELKLEFLQTMVFILVIASLVQFIEIVLKKAIPVIHSMLGIYLPMITTNCIILGAALLNIRENLGFLQSVVNGTGAGAGFLIAISMMSVVRERYENNPEVPRIFRGYPLALFSAGLMSIAFLGFQNLATGLEALIGR
ncbi:MAG: RnfABCDGE type electron transport complex subunit A [Treponema sp.]|nr:RnfABCDGE type electron transport complex subunit A [Treponema sp.]